MAMMSDPVEDLTRPKLHSQPFVGFVVDNNDAESKDGRKQQRLRIRVPQLHRNVPDDKLPWALPQGGSGNAGAGVGTVSVPASGTKLYVHFTENDPHNPQYGGSPTSDDVGKENELLKEEYPHTAGWIDNSNTRFAVNKESNTIDLQHPSGTTIHVDANGSVSVSCEDYMVGASGKITLVAAGVMSLNGSQVLINGEAPAPTTRTSRPRPRIPDQSGKTTA